MMREPRTVEEWADFCRDTHACCGCSPFLCINCACDYAKQQGEAAEEALLESSLISGCIGVVADLRRFGATSYADAIQAVERAISASGVDGVV